MQPEFGKKKKKRNIYESYSYVIDDKPLVYVYPWKKQTQECKLLFATSRRSDEPLCPTYNIMNMYVHLYICKQLATKSQFPQPPL